MVDKPVDKPINRDQALRSENEQLDNETEEKKKRKREKYERIRFRGKIHEEEQVVFDTPEEFIKFMEDNEEVKLQTTTRLNQKYKIAGYYIGRRKNEITIMRNTHENVAMCNPNQKLFDLERETLNRLDDMDDLLDNFNRDIKKIQLTIAKIVRLSGVAL